MKPYEESSIFPVGGENTAFAQYFDEDRPVICAAAEKVRMQFSEEEIDAARRVLDALLEAMQDGTSQKS